MTLPPLLSDWGQFVVFAPMRFRLKCGPEGAPLPVPAKTAGVAKSARTSALDAIARVFFRRVPSYIEA